MNNSTKFLNLFFQRIYCIGYFFHDLLCTAIKHDTKGAQVIVCDNDKFLLVRSCYRLQYTFPGGYINNNETSVQAVIRELAEEVNITVSESHLHLVKQIKSNQNGRLSIDYIYSCKLSNTPALLIDNREVVEAIFVSKKNAISLPLHYCVKETLEI